MSSRDNRLWIHLDIPYFLWYTKSIQMKYKVIRSSAELAFELNRVHLTLHEADLADMKGKVYLSKTEKRDKYTFIVIEQPDYDKTRKEFTLKEVFFVLNNNLLLIYDPHHSRYVDQFFAEVEQTQYKKANNADLMLGMLNFFSQQMYKAVAKFNTEVGEISRYVLDENDDRDLIGNVQRIQRNLIIFQSVLEPVMDLNRSLSHDSLFTQSEKSRDLLVSYSEKIFKVIKSVNNFEKQMVVLQESNESQIARKTNKNLGILTALNSLLLLPPIVVDIWLISTDHVLRVSDYIFLGTTLTVLTITVFVYLKGSKII